MKAHTNDGYKYLKEQGVGDENLWKIVQCHHEKIDGTGYIGLVGKEIPLFSRIISIADVYDALTSYRSYRTPMSPAMALEIIMGDASRAFDYEIVCIFLTVVELYPINSVVELSDKSQGVVIDNSYSLRPILRMLDNDEPLDLASLSNLSLIIERIIKDK
jgi:HD-GYP domain-containing protein (c-di-GMP phosphodiesterase class II)